MTWSNVQNTSAASSTSSSARNLVFGANVTAGDLLLVWVRTGAAAVTVTVTDSQSNSYSQVASYVTNGLQKLSLWYAIAGSTGACTVTVTPSGSANMGLGIQEYSNSLSALVADGNNSNTSSTTTSITVGTVTVSGSDDLSVMGAGYGNTNTVTAGSGYTARITLASSNGSVFVEDALDVTSNQSPTATLSGTTAWAALGATFKGTPTGALLRNLVVRPRIDPSLLE